MDGLRHRRWVEWVAFKFLENWVEKLWSCGRWCELIWSLPSPKEEPEAWCSAEKWIWGSGVDSLATTSALVRDPLDACAEQLRHWQCSICEPESCCSCWLLRDAWDFCTRLTSNKQDQDEHQSSWPHSKPSFLLLLSTSNQNHITINVDSLTVYKLIVQQKDNHSTPWPHFLVIANATSCLTLIVFLLFVPTRFNVDYNPNNVDTNAIVCE